MLHACNLSTVHLQDKYLLLCCFKLAKPSKLHVFSSKVVPKSGVAPLHYTLTERGPLLNDVISAEITVDFGRPNKDGI